MDASAADAVDESVWRRTSGDNWGSPEDQERAAQEDGSMRTESRTDDDDWDVEAAVERRVVQVMFTVPKSQLRVVNADAESRSLMSMEERAEIVDAREEDEAVQERDDENHEAKVEEGKK